MSFLYRAFKYDTRKLSKSILLFLTFLAAFVLILSGSAVKDALETARLNVRQALGGVFTMEQNMSDPNKWENKAVGGYGYQSFYTGAALTEELGKTVFEKVKGIIGFNATVTGYVVAKNSEGNTLKLIESDSGDGFSSLMSSFGDFGSTVSAIASTNTEFDSYFAGGYLELTEGRHIVSSEDENKSSVLIGEDLAKLNGLKTGDRLILQMSEFSAETRGIDYKKTQTEVEIAGIFKTAAKSSSMLSNWSMDNALYTTMNVLKSARPDYTDEGYEKISFYVSDPAEMDNIVKNTKALPEINPEDFIINADSSGADSVSKPLENIGVLVSVLIWAVLIAGAILLYLILSGRVKERVHETGVLLSLGFSKGNIVCQYLAEVLIIAVLAFPFSLLGSNLTSQIAGSVLTEYASDSGETKTDKNELGVNIDGSMIVNSSDFAPKFNGNGKLTEIKVETSPVTAVVFCTLGTAIIIFSVTMAALPVLKLKPKEILSKMN